MYIKDILNKKQKLVDEVANRDKVFIFEPVEEIALEIKKILVAEHFYPIVFKETESFLKKLTTELPKILFVSIVEEEGFNLLKNISDNSNLKKIPIIASGILKRNEKEAYEVGADIYLSKPLIWIIMPFLIRTLIFINDLKEAAPDKSFAKEINLNFNSKSEVIAEIEF